MSLCSLVSTAAKSHTPVRGEFVSDLHCLYHELLAQCIHDQRDLVSKIFEKIREVRIEHEIASVKWAIAIRNRSEAMKKIFESKCL